MTIKDFWNDYIRILRIKANALKMAIKQYKLEKQEEKK